MGRFPYIQIQTTNTAYTIINKTRKFQDAIKTWNQMNPFQQNWINFKTHFCIDYCKLEETHELTTENAGYHQANLINNTVAHMAGLSFPYPPQEPTYTQIPNSNPTIAPTA